MENLKEYIREILVQIREDAGDHLENTSLLSSGILDSVDIMNLIEELERKFDIEIGPEDVLSGKFESVDAIVTLIEKYLE